MMFALYAAGTGGGLWAAVQIERFLRATPAINSVESLERFKTLARQNMYLAIMCIPVLGTGFIIGLVLIWKHGLPALSATLALNALLLSVSRRVSRKESAAQNLPATTDDLAHEYDRVSNSWVQRILPDF